MEFSAIRIISVFDISYYTLQPIKFYPSGNLYINTLQGKPVEIHNTKIKEIQSCTITIKDI